MSYENIQAFLIDVSNYFLFDIFKPFFNFCRNTPLVMTALCVTIVLPGFFLLFNWIIDLSDEYSDLSFSSMKKRARWLAARYKAKFIKSKKSIKKFHKNKHKVKK